MIARKLLCLVTAICSFWMSTSCYAQDAPGLVAFDEVDESTVLMTGFIPVLDSGLATVVYGNEVYGFAAVEAYVYDDGTFAALVSPQLVVSSGSEVEMAIISNTTLTVVGAGNAIVIADPNEGIAEMFEGQFDTLEDAVGCIPPNDVTVLDERPTTNAAIVAIGFTTMIRCMSDCGTIYTVFYNPTTGKFAGAHVSSEQDDD